MNEFIIALESFQDAHVLFTGENISEDEIENKYDCRLNALTLKRLEKELMIYQIIFIGFHFTSFKDNLELTKLFLALSNKLIV